LLPDRFLREQHKRRDDGLGVGGSGGTAVSGTITPAIGFHSFPMSCPGGLHHTEGGTDTHATFFIVTGQI